MAWFAWMLWGFAGGGDSGERLPLPPAAPPNIIIFLADDMGIGDTSAYVDWTANRPCAQLHTPNLDRLANLGVRFTDAHSPSSGCTASRYALLTGRYCWRTWLKQGVPMAPQSEPLIEPARVTLPEFLQAAGYRTGLIGKWHLGLTYLTRAGEVAESWWSADLCQPIVDGPLDHGFAIFFGMARTHCKAGPYLPLMNHPAQRHGPGWIRGRTVTGATGLGKHLDGSYRLDTAGTLLDREAFAFLTAAVASEQPFFLYFASPANHSPYTPVKTLGGIPVAGASRTLDGCPTGSERADFIHQNDIQVGRLLDYLANTPDPRQPGRPLLENTLFLFASDNGADVEGRPANGPLRSSKGSLYEGGHRIPFLAAWPAGGVGDGNPDTPGRSCDRLLGLNDLFATFADILGRPLPPTTGECYGAEDSVSQLAALTGLPTSPRPPLFPNDHKEALTVPIHRERQAWVAVRSESAPLPGAWKLLLDHEFADHGCPRPRELYNLADDLGETCNRVHDVECQPVVDFLLDQARAAAAGQSR